MNQSENIELQVGVKAFIVDNQNKYLLLKRSNEKYPDVVDNWDVPGGRINVGNDLVTNLKREIKEETNLEIVGQPIIIAAQDILHVPGKHIVRLSFLSQSLGEIILQQNENTEYAWLTWAELAKHPGLDKFVKEICLKAVQPLHKQLHSKNVPV